MKTLPLRPSCPAAFSLTETVTAMAVFSMLVVALIYSHLLGLKMFNITATKLSASANARKALNLVRDDIRSAKTLYVGNGDLNSFSFLSVGSPRQGNALQLYPTAATNVYVRYFLDPAAQELKRVVSGATTPTAVAIYITNLVPFTAEDFAGNVLTNDQNNRVVRMSLEFYQWEFPIAHIGAGSYYDYYHLQTRMTRRTIE